MIRRGKHRQVVSRLEEVRRALFFRALHVVDTAGRLINKPLLQQLSAPFDGACSDRERIALLTSDLETRLTRRHHLDFKAWYTGRWPRGITPLFSLCFLLGLGSNYLGPSPHVNLLLNPFIALLLWNFAVYILLLVPFSFRPSSGSFLHGLFSWFRSLFHKITAGYRPETPKTEILARARLLFARLWVTEYGTLMRARTAAVFHILAAALVLGVTAGLYLRGLAQEYSFHWSSTFIKDPETQAAFLRLVFGPVLFFFPFRETLPPATLAEGAPWIHLFALSGLFYILLPRTVLAGFALRKAGRLAARAELDVKHPFFRELLSLFPNKPRRLFLFSYSYTITDATRDRLVDASQKLWGTTWRDGECRTIPWGEEVFIPPDSPDPEPVWLVCFNGVQTPEPEIHGAFARDLLTQAAKHRALLLLIVDHERVEDGSRTERHEAWRSVLPNRSFAWIDGLHLAEESLLAALDEAAGSESI